MRKTTQLLAGSLVALVLPLSITMAGWHSGNGFIGWGLSALGGVPATAGGGRVDRQVAEDWLRRARQEIHEGNFDLAESCLAQSESMKVSFDPLGDNPAKVRRELEAARRAFAGRQTADTATPTATPIRANTIYDPEVKPVAGQSAMPAADRGARGESDQLIVAARQALAVGDARKASALIQQAESLRVPYEASDDSPARVQDLIQRSQQLMADGGRASNSETYRRRRADLLLEQAEWLKFWNRLDDAERLAVDALNQGVRYGMYERNPNQLIEEIAFDRRAAGPATLGLSDGTQPSPRAVGVERLPTATGAASAQPDPKAQALQLIDQAREALAAGDLDAAERCCREAQTLNVKYASYEPRPEVILFDISKARAQRSGAGAPGRVAQPAPRAVTPGLPGTGAQPVAYQEEVPGPRSFAGPAFGGEEVPAGFADMSEAMRLFMAGEEAMRNRDIDKAMALYREAFAMRDQLDARTQQMLQDRLNLLGGSRRPQPMATPEALLGEADAARQILINQVSAEVQRKQMEAQRVKETDPKKAIGILVEARGKVESSALEPNIKELLMRRLDRDLAELDQEVRARQPELDLEARNVGTKEQIDRERRHKVEVGEKLAVMVDDFNKLMEEQRYREAELIARRAQMLAPDEPVVQSMIFQSRFVRNYQRQMAIRDRQDEGFSTAMMNVDESSVAMDDNKPYQFPDARSWRALTETRASLDRRRVRLSEAELEIQQKLKTPVSLQFGNKPLGEVVQYLAQLAAINIVLDPQGLGEEGHSSQTPITMDISHPISLQSALNLILEPLNLGYVIKDEVLKITSKHLRNGEVFTESYHVADLVIPIPNFIPSGSIGLAAAIQEALGQSGGIGGATRHAPVTVLAGQGGGSSNAMLNPNVLAQPGGAFGGSGAGASINGAGVGTGPGGVGSGVQPDFDSLIDLIVQTIKPDSWQEVGGPGSIKSYEQNLTLIVSQTQEVHEQIADLLEQLRRLQDLQVTIEVRFITLNDAFFERIGVDFDFDIDDDTDRPYQVFGQQNPAFTPLYGVGAAGNPPRDLQDRDHNKNEAVVGLSAPGVFSADLDIPFQSGSFPLSVPTFGGYQPGSGATMGFAILSDIEAFFFIEASQGDTRSNVLQAPKVTLFNGQVAFVADTAQSPFVISVIPVVGDFAVGFQPVVAVLSEGTFLTVQAVVSKDRRFVRLTLVPFFSSIRDVDEFTFTGSTTSIRGSTNSQDDDDRATTENETEIRSGTTVQLPTFAFVTVTTTVSVPDGGTVLLGGIKRLSEGRNEFGVPILNKIPYVNRLFRNVGIGRETQSLMMMVTPRIIVQEEEEALLGVTP